MEAEQESKTLFMSIGSGSSGNSYFLGVKQGGILIDAGIQMRTITKSLKQANLEIDRDVRGILVTHDHMDHIRTVALLASRYCIPVYATEKVFEGISKSRYIEDPIPYTSVRVIQPGQPFKICDYEIVAFSVPHDSRENVGYHICKNQMLFTLATDIGHLTPEIRYFLSKANYLVVEANYDKEMLMNGNYPDFLKERVSGEFGHLSNQETADCLAEIYHTKMKAVWLCHLSKENNHPDLCLKTVENRLYQEGIRVGKDLKLETLKRMSPSTLYELD